MGAFRLGETATELELAVNDSADRSTVKRADSVLCRSCMRHGRPAGGT